MELILAMLRLIAHLENWKNCREFLDKSFCIELQVQKNPKIETLEKHCGKQKFITPNSSQGV